jgi:type IV pilus assembly protein PilA
MRDYMIFSSNVKNEKGFTLIEIMIVIAIIGILAAIAIPQFNAYRVRAYNATTESQVKNCATAMAAFFEDNQTYVGATEDILAAGLGYTKDDTAHVSFSNLSAVAYTLTGTNDHGNTKTYIFNGPGGKITHN